MRVRTTAAVGGVALALLGSNAGSTATPPDDSAVPLPQPAVAMPLRLIVGDTIRIALGADPARRRLTMTRVSRSVPLAAAPPVTVGSGGPGVAPGSTAVGAATGVTGTAATQFASSNPAVAVVDAASGRIVALAPGTATITGTMAAVPDTARVVLQVVTARAATNLMVNEVCPNHDERFVAASLPVPASVPPIHEYHDCQRLIDGAAYSALVGIFAHEHVGQLARWDQFADGRLAAIIVNFPGNKGPQPYPWLRIAPGTNCLVLRGRGPDQWDAAILNQATNVMIADSGRQYGTCDDTLGWDDVPDSARGKLEVRVQRGVNYNGDSLAPPVARWDWDPANRRNYIGVKCGDRSWCEIGEPGFASSVPLTRRRSLWRPWVRDSVIKGYYDQQYLADSTGDNPTSVFGTITPGDDAKRRDQMDHQRRKWYNVALIELRDTNPTMTPDYTRYVREYLGLGSGESPSAPLLTSKYDLYPGGSLAPDEMYRGRLNRRPLGGKKVVYRYHSALKHLHAPVVRWRWDEKDERIWSYCDPDGCCEKKPTT